MSEEIIKQIRESNDIVEVIGSYLPLTQRGKNYFALCPFHSDHSPSMSVSPDKQIFRCFTCKKSGNVITFVMEYENVNFTEALRILAQRVGIKVNVPKVRTVNKEFEIGYQIYDIVNSFYKNNLDSVLGENAREYLKNRGINKEIIKEFDIGLSVSNKLYKMLNKTYDAKILEDLDIIRKQDSSYADVFQNRIMFPIKDEEGNVVAFSGRIYNSVSDSKYINSKETFLFKKSNILYNFNKAKDNIRREKSIIICEGFMDVIRLWSIGYKNAVALMGTSLTDKHFELITKLKVKIILNLDQDNAGKTATISIGEELLKNNIDVSVIIFDDYKDSDEFISSKGKEAFDIAYNNRIPFIDFKFKYLKSNKNMKDTTDISKYINEAISTLNELNDDILKELKIKELANEFNIDESIIKGKIKKSITKPKIALKQEIKKKRYNKYDISEIRLLYLMLHYDDVILYFENTLGYLIHDNMSNLAHKIIEFRETYGYFDYSDFIDYVAESKDINETLKEVMKYHNDDNYTIQELDDYINTIKKYSVEEKIKKLKQEMNDTLDINKKIEIAKEIENINKEVLKW